MRKIIANIKSDALHCVADDVDVCGKYFELLGGGGNVIKFLMTPHL